MGDGTGVRSGGISIGKPSRVRLSKFAVGWGFLIARRGGDNKVVERALECLNKGFEILGGSSQEERIVSVGFLQGVIILLGGYPSRVGSSDLANNPLLHITTIFPLLSFPYLFTILFLSLGNGFLAKYEHVRVRCGLMWMVCDSFPLPSP